MKELVTRLRINLNTKELEVEGSEDFVREQLMHFENLVTHKSDSQSDNKPKGEQPPSNGQSSIASGSMPSTFGEYLHSFPSDLKEVDKILVAGYYIQSQNAEKQFATGEAHDMLKQQGIKLTNAADSVKLNNRGKKVFAVEKGKFRVSQTGIDHINSLLNNGG